METETTHEDNGFVSRFLGVVCQFKPFFGLLLTVEILFVLLGALAFLFNPPGSAGRVVLYLTLSVNVPILLCTAGLIYVCGTVSQ